MADFIQTLDEKILFFIQDNLHNGFLDILMPFITFLGSSGGLVWIAACVALIFSKKYRMAGIMGICVILLSNIASEYLIKSIVQRPRPFILHPQELLISKPGGYSFPSSHTTVSFAVSTVLFISIKKYGFILFTSALLISFSRLYLFVHYPSDVITGAITGLLCSLAVLGAFKKFVPGAFNLK
jgi:undecaprenyl-diphosphatase